MENFEDLAKKIYAQAMSMELPTFESRNASRRFEERVFLSIVGMLDEGHVDEGFIARSALERAKHRF